jgi:fucose permease
MPVVVLACLAYVSMALPDSVLGIAWPAMSTSFHQPLAALGLLLPFGIGAAVLSSTMTGRILDRTRIGWLLSGSTVLSAVALFGYSVAPSLWAVLAATVLLGLASGAVDSGLNAYAARRFGARDITWMHASYGLGAVIGPVTVTAALAGGLTWRWPYALIAAAQLALACAFVLTTRRWAAGPDQSRTAEYTAGTSSRPVGARRSAVAVSIAVFALHTGIEGAAGLWAYVYLTAGHGLPPGAAGLAISGYWATLCVGRVVLGVVAEHVGAARVLTCAVAGIVGGTAMMAVPGPAVVALAGLAVLGLAAAPVFPLLILTTAQRVGHDHADRTIGCQIAAGSIGAAVLPAGIGLLLQHLGGTALGPILLALALVLAAVYSLLVRLTSGDMSQHQESDRAASA